jgi:uncharacterized membrane protein
MDKRTLRWVYQELPELVSQGIVPVEVAARIRQHYGEPEAAGSTARRWAIILFSILGAVLIGGGIILLLAHNWDELSRPVRAVISITPLTIAAALGGWLLWTQRASTAWREGVGTFQTLAIGAAIALVAQTYNLGGRFDEFMLTWSLLALPVAYLLRATLPALLYLVGITIWAGASWHAPDRVWYFALVGASLPYLWWTSRENRYHPRPVLFAWVLAVTVCVGTGLVLDRVLDDWRIWPAVYGALFAVLFLVGARWWGGAGTAWQRPLQNVGALGAFGLALVLSFNDPWRETRWGWEEVGRREVLEAAIAALLPVTAIALWVRSWARRAWLEVMLGAVAALAVIGVAWEGVGALLFNLYLFGLGMGTLVVGLRGRRLGTVNAGMAVLAGVILCRFFDSDLGFLFKGVAFIVVGTGFLVTNLVLLRWKGAVK